MSLAREIVLTIPGLPFQLSAERLRQELLALLAEEVERFAVARIFEFIALTERNRGLQERLVARGDFERQDDGTYLNRGATIDRKVYDLGPDIQELRLYVPRRLSLAVRREGDDLLVVPTEGSRVLAVFDAEPLPGAGRQFVLDRIEGTLERWHYRFHNDFDPESVVLILVDLTLAGVSSVVREPDPLRGRRLSLVRQLVAAESLAAIGPCACDCCKGFEPAKPGGCPNPAAHLRLRFRCIVLLDRSESYESFRVWVERQINAMTALYAEQRVAIELVALQTFVDPARLRIDPGQCFRGRPSADTRELFSAYAGEVGAGEIVGFIVRQVVGLAGCAAHPDGQPGFVMDRTISDPRDSVMGHELGHVLSLVHVPDRRNLMWGDDGAVIVDPPPDLNADQIRSLRCQRWLEEI